MTTAKLLTCIAFAALLCGCCGLGMPSEEKVRRWVAPLTPGTPADQAFKLLEKKGFEPHYLDVVNEHGIRGQRRSECLYITDFLNVYVALDDQDRVTSVNVQKSRMVP